MLKWVRNHIKLPKFHIKFTLKPINKEVFFREICLLIGFVMVFAALYGLDWRVAFGICGLGLMKFSGLVMRG